MEEDWNVSDNEEVCYVYHYLTIAEPNLLRKLKKMSVVVYYAIREEGVSFDGIYTNREYKNVEDWDGYYVEKIVIKKGSTKSDVINLITELQDNSDSILSM